ncbi:hypothetical protein NDU88_005461 [Pleurodeles waltl]|uniref:Uncharacterized protein n=1 Tax=Pleurodeles waltl TaxID=8319 RepID=A0AAV7NMK0_PLEWA|nr:hypothetical protein NDU88_005461 [Pleurodeles waltl]
MSAAGSCERGLLRRAWGPYPHACGAVGVRWAAVAPVLLGMTRVVVRGLEMLSALSAAGVEFWGLCLLLDMGCGDPKQQKLPFEKQKQIRMAAEPARDEDGTHDGPIRDQAVGAEGIMAKLRAGFRAIVTRFDYLTARLDNMESRLDKLP